jgi:hypothetical protein
LDWSETIAILFSPVIDGGQRKTITFEWATKYKNYSSQKMRSSLFVLRAMNLPKRLLVMLSPCQRGGYSWPTVIKETIERRCQGGSNGEITKCSILSIGYGDLCAFRFDRNALERFESNLGRAVGGDRGNPAAAFFLDRYYGNNLIPILNTYALKRFAAHIILLGGKLNTAFINGLDMVVWDQKADKIESVTRTEIIALAKWSDVLDKAIDRVISDGSKIQVA